MIYTDRMTVLLYLTLLFSAARSVGAGVPGIPQEGKQSELVASFQAVVSEYQEIFSTRNVSALATFYAEDADMIFGNTPKVQGREAVAAWWQGYFNRQEPERSARFGVEAARLIADRVALLNISSWTGGRDARGEELHPRKARGTWILVRSGDRWLISALRGLPSEQDQVILTPSPKATVVEKTVVLATRVRGFVHTYEEAFNRRDPSGPWAHFMKRTRTSLCATNLWLRGESPSGIGGVPILRNAPFSPIRTSKFDLP